MPGRLYPINYLFIEITNACNFKCTWCPDDVMGRRRGFMKKEKVFGIPGRDRGQALLARPDLPGQAPPDGRADAASRSPAIVEYAESRGVGIELNTNCGLITPENIEALYRAGLTNLILSYQTPDADSFKTRKAPRIAFDAYRDKVRLAVEKKVALGARTHLEIDIMNTKYADSYKIVSEDEQAMAFLEDWIAYARSLELRYGLAPARTTRSSSAAATSSTRTRTAAATSCWTGWCSSGSAATPGATSSASTTSIRRPPSRSPPSPARARAAGRRPIRVTPARRIAPRPTTSSSSSGTAMSCPAVRTTKGLTKTANVFASSIEDVWKSETVRQRKQDMLDGTAARRVRTLHGPEVGGATSGGRRA